MIGAAPSSYVNEIAQMAMEDLSSRIIHLEDCELCCMDRVSDIVTTQLAPLAETFQSLPSSSPSLIEIKKHGDFSVRLLWDNLTFKTRLFQEGHVSAEAIFPFQFLPRTLHLASQYAWLQQMEIVGKITSTASQRIEIIKHGPFLNAAKPIRNITELFIHYYVSGLPHVLDASWSDTTRLATPFCICDLFEATNEGNASLTAADYPRLIKEILTGLYHLHQRGVVHCDLKDENIFLVNDPKKPGTLTVKIADFGLSSLTGTVEKPRGTPCFIAPEILSDPRRGSQNPSPVLPPRDIWAAGLVLWGLTHTKPLIKERPDRAAMLLTIFQLTQKKIDAEINKDRSDPQLNDLLKRMLCKDPLGRITAKEALTHPYLTR